MIRKLKIWLRERYLPEYCRQKLLEENNRLRQKLDKKEREIIRLNGYVEGLEEALRALSRVILKGVESIGDTERIV